MQSAQRAQRAAAAWAGLCASRGLCETHNPLPMQVMALATFLVEIVQLLLLSLMGNNAGMW